MVETSNFQFSSVIEERGVQVYLSRNDAVADLEPEARARVLATTPERGLHASQNGTLDGSGV